MSGEKQIQFEQWVPHPVEKVFAFFASEHNLETLTPPWLHFRVLGASTPQLTDGTLIDYSLKIRGIPCRWQSRIESWEPNVCFVDLQTKGPYAFWHHTHQFISRDGGTLMTDAIRYRLRFSALAKLFLIDRFVSRDIAAIFAYRQKKIAELFR